MACFSRGVFTVFGNKIGKSRVFLPTRILEADGLTDTFQSLGHKQNRSCIFTYCNFAEIKSWVRSDKNDFFIKL